ncbi:hypothetical protein [Acaryochloris sp. IP29b_bin.137]|nr:hypothetical protein [Acaryochloris sp. IP29b_bin.137]
MPKVRCAVCKTFHPIDGLMATTTAKPEWQDAVSELSLFYHFRQRESQDA